MESVKFTDVGDGFVRLDIIEGSEEGLFLEKSRVNTTMINLELIFNKHHMINYKRKNFNDSVKYRKDGNTIYTSTPHKSDAHIKTLKLYTQSIAAAPNDSQALALAYGNRSALLYHLKEYSECIKDCERAIKITNSDLLKAKLLFRKLECLVALESNIAKDTCEETLALFKLLDLNTDVRDKFIGKLNSILNTISTITFKEKEISRKTEELPNFTRQVEAPCASTAIAIKYNNQWGRHIVATRKIEPGEILVIEKSYLTSIEFDQIYLFCSNCSQQTWASVPCDSCIYSIYCSRKCKLEAWEKYHQFECSILSYIYNINAKKFPYLSAFGGKNYKSNLKFFRLALRFLLLSVHELGGINKLRDELINIQKCQDYRIKGFSPGGIFKSEKCRSILSLLRTRDFFDFNVIAESNTIIACIGIYYLATESTFFGKKLTTSASQLMLNEDVKLIGALLLRSLHSVQTNFVEAQYFVNGGNDSWEKCTYGLSLDAFCNLFNHSCNPNVKHIISKNNDRIIYATNIIEKGQQLFLCYVGDDFTSYSKSHRQNILKNLYCFDCECLACKEDWSTSVRLVKDILKESFELQTSLERKYKNLKALKNEVFTYLKNTNFRYEMSIMKDLQKLMIEHSNNFTARSEDYKIFEKFMHRLLLDGFGKRLDIAEKC